MLKKMFVSVVTLVMISGSYAQAGPKHPFPKHPMWKPGKGNNGPLPDAGQSGEPPAQTDENVGDFQKGPGGPPKNGNSKPHKGVKIHSPITGGNGCQSGTVGAAMTEDQKTLSIVFDDYIANAGATYGTKRDIKTCSVTVPIEVPAGLQVTIVKLDYRGFNSVPPNARTRYVTMYSFFDADKNKQIGKRIRRKFDFVGPLEEEYTISSDISSVPVWSQCGKSVNFRIDTRVVAASNQNNEDTIATIDSIDASAGTNVLYSLLWQECQP